MFPVKRIRKNKWIKKKNISVFFFLFVISPFYSLSRDVLGYKVCHSQAVKVERLQQIYFFLLYFYFLSCPFSLLPVTLLNIFLYSITFLSSFQCLFLTFSCYSLCDLFQVFPFFNFFISSYLTLSLCHSNFSIFPSFYFSTSFIVSLSLFLWVLLPPTSSSLHVISLFHSLLLPFLWRHHSSIRSWNESETLDY